MMTFLQTMEHDDSSDSVDISMMKNGIAPDYPPPHSDGITIVCLSIGVSSSGSTLYKVYIKWLHHKKWKPIYYP